jgi:predicted TIM-barrel fold metal-dependent hydrolase
MAVLPAADTDDALAELQYALDVLRMDAVSLPTSVQDVYLGDVRFDPLFEELNRREATLFVHPVQATASEPLNLGLNQSVLEFPFDTTRMIANMILSGAVRRFPHIKIIASHGGGTLPYLLTRLQTLEPVVGAGPGRRTLSSEEIREDAARFYYDLTAATSRAHLAALTDMVPTTQLLTGFDIPFMPTSSMRPALEDLRAWPGFDAEDLHRIEHANAADLFPEAARRALNAPSL